MSTNPRHSSSSSGKPTYWLLVLVVCASAVVVEGHFFGIDRFLVPGGDRRSTQGLAFRCDARCQLRRVGLVRPRQPAQSQYQAPALPVYVYSHLEKLLKKQLAKIKSAASPTATTIATTTTATTSTTTPAVTAATFPPFSMIELRAIRRRFNV